MDDLAGVYWQSLLSTYGVGISSLDDLAGVYWQSLLSTMVLE